MIRQTFTASLLLLFAAGLQGQNDTPQAIVDRAAALFSPTAHGSDSLHLDSARCVGALLPAQNNYQTTGQKDGEVQGVVSCRVGENWSPPALVSGEFDRNHEITGRVSPVIFATDSDAATQNLLHGEFKLDSGSGFEFAGSRSRLSGLLLKKDDEQDRVLYGSDATYETILKGKVEPSASEHAFSKAVSSWEHTASWERINRSPAGEQPSIGLDSVETDSSPLHGGGATGTRRRTGYAYLLRGSAEESGYGLYSYILFDHHPSADEHNRFVKLLVAVLARPPVESLQRYVARQHINITEIPLDVDRPAAIPQWQSPELYPKMADWILDNYDYGRATAILGSLPKGTGPGPVILSVLHPVNPEESPRPVFLQDLSLAQPELMAAYVGQFVQQAGKDRFWDEPALVAFGLGLSNLLQTAAKGLGLSADGVKPWLKMIK